MTILVKVTKDVLERSKMCGFVPGLVSTNCMISVALRDLFPMATVGNPAYWLTNDQSNRDGLLPEFVCLKVSEFDRLYPDQRVNMTPFSFELEVPDYVIEKIGIGEIYRVLSESQTLELIMPNEQTI